LKRKIKSVGILYHIMDYGDSSQIFKAFTHFAGEISILAKGFRKQTKTQIPECFNEYEFILYEPLDRGLYLLSELNFIQNFGLRYDPKALAAAACSCELLSNLILPDDELGVYYHYLSSYLLYLKEHRSNVIALFWRFFLRILINLGLPFSLERCHLCNNVLGQKVYVSRDGGGLHCEACFLAGFSVGGSITRSEEADQEWQSILSDESRRIVHLLPEIGLYLENMTISPTTIREINRLFVSYFQNHFHKTMNLKALKVLEALCQ